MRERDDVSSRVRTISVLSVLLQGPFDTGNAILGSQNLVDLMIQMAGSSDPLQEVIDLLTKLFDLLNYLVIYSVLPSKLSFYQHRRKIKLREF